MPTLRILYLSSSKLVGPRLEGHQFILTEPRHYYQALDNSILLDLCDEGGGRSPFLVRVSPALDYLLQYVVVPFPGSFVVDVSSRTFFSVLVRLISPQKSSITSPFPSTSIKRLTTQTHFSTCLMFADLLPSTLRPPSDSMAIDLSEVFGLDLYFLTSQYWRGV